MSSGLIRLNLTVGVHTFLLDELGLTWPPPERLIIEDGGIREATDDDSASFVLHRVSISSLTDEEIADMSHVVRGAEYRYADAFYDYTRPELDVEGAPV